MAGIKPVSQLFFYPKQSTPKDASENEYKKKQQELERQNAEKLETHKNSLNHQSELAITQLRAQLELKASERNIKLTTVFEDQAKVIVTLYGKLLPMLDAAEDYTMLIKDSDQQNRIDKLKTFAERCNDYFDYFRPNRIYLPQTTSKQANELTGTLVKLVNKYHMTEKLLKLQPLTEPGLESLNKLDEQVEAMQASISPLLLTLETEFQKILGFPMPEKEK